MALLGELGRFLEKGTEVLAEVSATLRDARETLVALRPTIDGLPALVRDTQALVGDARNFLREVTPLVAEAARKSVDVLESARKHREDSGR